MENNDVWLGIYKGLRLPVLGIVLLILAWVIFKGKNKDKYEEARYTMLDDDVDQGLGDKFRPGKDDKVSSKKG